MLRIVGAALPDPAATGFLLIVLLASFAIDVWLLRALLRFLRSGHLKPRDRVARTLMSLGSIVFLGAVQFACLIVTVTRKPIGLWPGAYLVVLELLAYTGIALVVFGIVGNAKRLFQ